MMEKVEVIRFLAEALRHHSLSNEERDAIRAAINTETWVIARRAKQRRNKKLKEQENSTP